MKRKIFSVLLTLVMLLTLSLVTAAPVSANPGPDLVGLWHFDEGTGTTAFDSSGNGNDGTLEGGFGTALSFDGNGYVEIASNSSIMPVTLTVEAWIRPGKTGARQSIVSKWDGMGDASYSLELTSTNKFLFYLHDGTTTQSITGTTVITVGEWYHVAGTYDGSNATLFVNGVAEAGPTPLVAPMTTSSVPLRIGASAGASPYPIHSAFQGLIDEVRLSNVVRTSFDLGSPYVADANTVALWHFDEGTGQVAADSAGSNAGQLGSTNVADSNDPTWVVSDVPAAGPQWVSDQWGGSALSFDGADDYVNVGDTSTQNWTDLTTEAWVYWDGGTVSGYAGVYYKGAHSDIGRLLINSAGKVLVQNGNGNFFSDNNGDVPKNEWFHIAYVYDQTAGQEYIYVNGDIKGQQTRTGDIAQNSTSFRIGYGWYGSTYYVFSGLIDEVRIWDTATPTFNFDADPDTDYNPVNTDHTITATVTIDRTDVGTEPAPGVKVDFDITGPNSSESTTKYTQSDGVATLTYTSNGTASQDSINVSIGWDWCAPASETVEKYWLENFVTGGGKLNMDTLGLNGKKPAVTFAGTVGVLEGVGIVGQFQIVDHTVKGAESWHSSNFTSLKFTGDPAESPPASHDTATFTGTFTSNRGGLATVTIIIVDNGEPGAGVDTIEFLGLGSMVIDGGNFQVHDME